LSTDPEVEGTHDAWPDVIEWKPGYGAANLPPPRSRPDSTFPLKQVTKYVGRISRTKPADWVLKGLYVSRYIS
jgi:hypothetical protein